MGVFNDWVSDGLGSTFSAWTGSGNKNGLSSGKKRTVQEAFTARRAVYGIHLVKPTMIYAHATGNHNARLAIHYVIASQHSQEITKIYFNDELVMESNGEFFLNAWHGFDDVDPSLAPYRVAIIRLGQEGIGFNNNYEGPWASWDKLEGHTAFRLELKYSSSLYANGIPSVTCEIKGRRLYDPRTTLTEYSDNYALCILDWLLTGIEVPQASINIQSFIDAANVCDELVPIAGGGTEKRFTVSGVLELDKTPLENLETLLESGGGWISYVQGQWQITLPIYTLPILDLTESDLLGDIRFQPKSGKKDRVNIAKGSYISPEHDWERVDAPVLKVQEYIDNDGEKLENAFDYDMVSSGYQVQRLNKIKLEQSRYGLSITAPIKFRALRVTVGDRVTLSIKNFNWVSRVFLVIRTEVDYQNGIRLTLREDAPEIYEWVEGDALEIVSPVALSLPDHSNISAPDSVSVTQELYQTNNIKEVKARAFIDWVEPEESSYKYDAQIKETGMTEWTPLVWRSHGKRVVLDDVKPANYDIRVRSINDVGFESDWLQINEDILGKMTPPPDVDSLFIDGGVLTWTYLNPPLDLDGFEVRSHDGTRQTWADAQQLHTGIVSSSRFTLPTSIGGTKTFLVKAIDTSRNYSNLPAIATVGLGDPSISNVVITHDYQEGLWQGAITAGLINGSNEIEANQVGAFYNPDGNSIFYNQTGSSSFYDSEFMKLVYEFTYTVSAQDKGSQLTFDIAVVGDSYQIEFIPPSIGGITYSTFPGYVTAVEEGQYRFRLSIPSQFGAVVPKISSVNLNLDVPDITEAIENFSISSSGTRLPLTKTYRGIRYVTLTMQTDGSGVASLKVDDKDESQGPLVFAYNTSGTPVNTIIDAFIRGY